MSEKTKVDSAASPLWNDKQLAKTLNVDERTPAQWRYLGKFKNELPWLKIGRSVRYRESDVLAFIAKQ